jgi:hypothetical protein
MVNKIILPSEIKLSRKQKMARGGLAAEWDVLNSEENRLSQLMFKINYELEPGAKVPAELKRLGRKQVQTMKRKKNISDEMKALEEEGSDSKRRAWGKPGNPFIQIRDEWIRKLSHQSAKEICHVLDTVMTVPVTAPAGSPRNRSEIRTTPASFPQSWKNKYGVQSFSEAYKHPKCRDLVNTMISKARKAY